MIVKTYQSTKVKGFANSLGTWGWTLLIVGGIIVGGLALRGVMDKTVTIDDDSISLEFSDERMKKHAIGWDDVRYIIEKDDVVMLMLKGRR